ncbi:Rap1-interacting factor 1 N terminal-domain-containing protein [Catenaria anguillulae PL171]|uniref:Rap1-interacting factor 1 N terminal-domain-containing protein n=1 Tax=Catenaria anguillulae PL171 TaxID=765915 RepID=A0A1Y2HCN6_9FUNG|nr:Rap1-interacting factor 1 N terminal-domain-containing protein [Catenaria anguillulae PL171]
MAPPHSRPQSSAPGAAATPVMPTGRQPATAPAPAPGAAIVPATPALLATATSGRFTTPACESPHRADDQVHTDYDFAQLHSSPAPKLPEEHFASRRTTTTTTTEATDHAASANASGGSATGRARPNAVDNAALSSSDQEDDPELKAIQDLALPTVDPQDAVPELVRWLLEPEDPTAWIFAYRSLLVRIREAQSADEHHLQQQQPGGVQTVAGGSVGADENAPREPTQEQELAVLAPRMSDVVKVFKRDISPASDDVVIHEALKLLGFVLYTPRLFNVIGPQITSDLIQRALILGKSTEDKSTCHLCIWVLRMQRLPSTHFTSRAVLGEIIDTLAYALRVPAPFQSTVIPTEAIFALDSLLRLLPRPVLGMAKEWLLPACMNLAATNDLVRKHCIEFFQAHLLMFAEESAKLQPALDFAWEKYSVRMIFDLTELTNKHERDGMKAWSISMVLYAAQMQKHQQFINGMLKIVERYFNMKRASAKLYGYRAWTYLVYASAVTRTLTQERRVKLLMIPMLNSFSHDRFAQLRLCAADAWINLVYAMGTAGAAAWPQLALEAAIKPALPRLVVAKDPDVRSAGWAVFDVLVNVADSDPIVNPNAEINLAQLMPLLNPDLKPTDYLRNISVGPKWFRSHVGDLLSFVRAGHFMGPRQFTPDQMVPSPGMHMPALPIRTHEAFRRIILGLARACSKDIHLSNDSVGALLKVGEFLADMIHPPAAIVEEAANLEDMLAKQGAEAAAAAASVPSGDNVISLQPTCPDPCWRMDMLDLILSTVASHMPARLLQSKRCRYGDLEETCRVRIREGSVLADQLFTFADVHLTPAVYLVLLWVESWSADDLVAAANARAESEMQNDQPMQVKRLSSAVGGSEADPMPTSTARSATELVGGVKMPMVADDPARVAVYWEKYAELVRLAADSQGLVHSLYSILYLLEVQTASYPLKVQLNYWIPIAELLTTHLRSQRARASTSTTPGHAPNSLSDDYVLNFALDASQQHDDLIPSLLMWPVCKVLECVSTNPASCAMDTTLDFPQAEWTKLWDLATSQDANSPRLIKNPFFYHHLFARTAMQVFDDQACLFKSESLLVAMTGVTSVVLNRYAATLKSARVASDDPMPLWVALLLAQVRYFTDSLARGDEVQGPLSAAVPMLTGAVADAITAGVVSRSAFAVANVELLLDAWTNGVCDVFPVPSTLDNVLTSDGLREYHQVMARVWSSLLKVWLDPRFELPVRRIMQLAGHVFVTGMSDENPVAAVRELAIRAWNAKFADAVDDPEWIDAMSDEVLEFLRNHAGRAVAPPFVLPRALMQETEQAHGEITGSQDDGGDLTVIAPDATTPTPFKSAGAGGGADAMDEDVTDEDERATAAGAIVKARRAAAMALATHITSSPVAPTTPATPMGSRFKPTRARDEDALADDTTSMDDDDEDDSASTSPLHKKRRMGGARNGVGKNGKAGTPRRSAARTNRPSGFGADSQTEYVVIPPSPAAPAAGTPLGKRRMDSNGDRLLTERQMEREEERAFIPPMFNALDHTQSRTLSLPGQGAAGAPAVDGDQDGMDVDENELGPSMSATKPSSRATSRPPSQDSVWTFNHGTGQPSLDAEQVGKLSFSELVNLQGLLLQWTGMVQSSMSRAIAHHAPSANASAQVNGDQGR